MCVCVTYTYIHTEGGGGGEGEGEGEKQLHIKYVYLGPFSERSDNPEQLIKPRWHCQVEVKLYLVGSIQQKENMIRWQI